MGMVFDPGCAFDGRLSERPELPGGYRPPTVN